MALGLLHCHHNLGHYDHGCITSMCLFSGGLTYVSLPVIDGMMILIDVLLADGLKPWICFEHFQKCQSGWY